MKPELAVAFAMALIGDDFEEVNRLIDENPIKEEKKLNIFEAFDAMHKQDGTSKGRRKCDFAL